MCMCPTCCSSAWHGLRSATGQSAAGQTVCLCASLNVSCFSCLFPTFSLLRFFVLAHLLCVLLFSHLHIMFFGGCCLFCLHRFGSLAIMWCAKCSDVWEGFATHFLFQNIKVKAKQCDSYMIDRKLNNVIHTWPLPHPTPIPTLPINYQGGEVGVSNLLI